MIEELREKIGYNIKLKQEQKEKLYEDISNVDSCLFELNEMLVKLNEEDAFFKMTPYEAFEFLNNLGYNDPSEIYDMYFRLLNRDKKLVNNLDDVESKVNYIELIENSNSEITKQTKKLLKKVIELLVDNFYDDNKYYYIAKNKISKFIAYYNMACLFSNDYNKEDLISMIAISLCYKNVCEDKYDIIKLEVEKLKDKIEKLV